MTLQCVPFAEDWSAVLHPKIVTTVIAIALSLVPVHGGAAHHVDSPHRPLFRALRVREMPRPVFPHHRPVRRQVKPLVSAAVMAAWQRVAECEVGGDWSMQGPVYSGIGFRNDSWLAYGGAQFAPNAGLATPMEQVIVAERIEGSYIPDQYGCAGGW